MERCSFLVLSSSGGNPEVSVTLVYCVPAVGERKCTNPSSAEVFAALKCNLETHTLEEEWDNDSLPGIFLGFALPSYMLQQINR